MAIHQDEDLARVTVLGELLRPPMHVADDRLGADDHLAVQLEDDPEHPVCRRMLRADVEDHLLGAQLPLGDDLDAAAAQHPGVARGRIGGALLEVHRPKRTRGFFRGHSAC